MHWMKQEPITTTKIVCAMPIKEMTLQKSFQESVAIGIESWFII